MTGSSPGRVTGVLRPRDRAVPRPRDRAVPRPRTVAGIAAMTSGAERQ
ncbi:hypothetical protein [Microbispora sp. NPDC049633]